MNQSGARAALTQHAHNVVGGVFGAGRKVLPGHAGHGRPRRCCLPLVQWAPSPPPTCTRSTRTFPRTSPSCTVRRMLWGGGGLSATAGPHAVADAGLPRSEPACCLIPHPPFLSLPHPPQSPAARRCCSPSRPCRSRSPTTTSVGSRCWSTSRGARRAPPGATRRRCQASNSPSMAVRTSTLRTFAPRRRPRAARVCAAQARCRHSHRRRAARRPGRRQHAVVVA